jgi:predicted NAD/FAD-binding protein
MKLIKSKITGSWYFLFYILFLYWSNLKQKAMYSRSVILCFLFCVVSLIAYSQDIPLKVAVIGGGMSGISAVHHIQELDSTVSITLFEKEKLLGGNAKTVLVTNSMNEIVNVDAGPQYYTEGPWNDYIEFLKTHKVYDEINTTEFVGSISIQNEGAKRPVLITPLNGSFRGEKLGKLLSFKKFFDLSFEIYKNPSPIKHVSIGSWVKNLEMEPDFKQQVVLPFLAAALGTTVAEIKQTSTVDIVKLFAFRKPSNKSTFKVMNNGMGTLIQDIGENIEKRGALILCDSPVKMVSFENGKYKLSYSYKNDQKHDFFDFVVIAVHAYQAEKLLKDDVYFEGLSTILKDFEYFKAHIVLHRDESLVNVEKPAFLNVLTTIENQIAANTMNLGMIHDRYRGIYKSWLTEEMAANIKRNGKFIHEEIFWHPLITPKFNESLDELNKESEKYNGLSIAGGWTLGLETQQTAVLSGKKAAEKYIRFKASN